MRNITIKDINTQLEIINKHLKNDMIIFKNNNIYLTDKNYKKHLTVKKCLFCGNTKRECFIALNFYKQVFIDMK